MKKRKYKKLFFICISILLVFLLLAGVMISAVDQLSELGFTGSELEFNSKLWKEADKIGGKREMMLNDLLNYIKKGDSEQWVVETLGAPDEKMQDQYQYLLSIGYDPCYLVLDFENKQLVEIERECN